MTRKDFIALASSAAVSPAFGGIAPSTPVLRLGILSDIHLCALPAGGDGPGDRKMPALAFERALRYFRDKGVDAVVMPGDLTEYGLVSELRHVAAIWNSVFPSDRGADGEKVAKLFILGNHDAIAWRWKSSWTGEEWKGEDRKAKWRESIARDPAAAWRECFGEDYAPILERSVKGVRFVLASWLPKPEDSSDWRGGADVPGLQEWFDARRQAYSDGRPFFYVQHAHPRGTCFFSSVAADSGTSTRVLSAFPNAIALSGHAHQPLTDERNVWQGAFTSIGTASLINAGGRNWRENGAPYAQGASPFAHMPYLKTKESRHGMYARLYADRLEIERRDFNWGLSVGPDWTVPLDGSKAFAFEPRAAASVAPEFSAGAAVSTEWKDGKTDDGRPMPYLRVTFPAATEFGRVYDYEAVCTVLADDHERVATTKRVLAPDFHLPPEKRGRPGEVWFARCEMPKGAKVRISVSPINCFGKRGRNIAATVDV